MKYAIEIVRIEATRTYFGHNQSPLFISTEAALSPLPVAFWDGSFGIKGFTAGFGTDGSMAVSLS